MSEQQEMNFFKYYSDGLNRFSECFLNNRLREAVSVPETLRMLSKSATESVELYDLWLQGLHDLTDESFAIGRKIADGKKTDADALIQASEKMRDSLMNRITETVKEMPYKGIEPIVKSLKESADSLNGSTMIKAFLQPVIDTGVSAAAILKSSYNTVSELMTEHRQSPEAA